MSDVQWERIKGRLPGRKEPVGRTAVDNRVFANGVLWVIRSGARWHDLPERYGKYKSVHKRFMRWAAAGVWEQVFADLLKDKKNAYLMLASTIVRAHQQAASGRKKGGSEDKAMGRSVGGLSTKIHLLSDELGLPVCFRITGGQRHDSTEAAALLGSHLAEAVITDKGYDSEALVQQIEAMGARAVIPTRRYRRVLRHDDPELYKLRNRIQRCFSRLKQFQRLATRYCKSDIAFRATVALACIWIRL